MLSARRRNPDDLRRVSIGRRVRGRRHWAAPEQWVRVLLDTPVWLWALSSPERLDPGIQELLANPDNVLLLSAASSWEIAVKYRLGKLPLPEPPETFVPARLARDGILGLPIQHVHALRVATLPDHHRDPFDRLLIAQAQVDGLPIVTADHRFRDYDVEVLAAGRR